MANERRHISDSLLLKLTQGLRIPAAKTVAEAWEELGLDKRRWLLPDVVVKIAASLSIILISTLIYNGQHVNIHSDPGEYLDLYLPDNSFVKLNAASSISYDKWLWFLNRSVNLTGEGYFEVKKGSKFTVSTERTDVEVLGTRFNVKDRPESKVEIICTEGKVAVEGNGGTANVVLNAGEKVAGSIMEGNKERLSPNSNPISWLNNEFYFNQASLEEVVEELKRQFGMDIILSNDQKDRIYSGYFNNSDLKEALELVCRPLGLKYNFADKQVRIFKTEKK